MEMRRRGANMRRDGNMGAGRPGLWGCKVDVYRYRRPLIVAMIDCIVLRNIEYVNFSLRGPYVLVVIRS